MNSDSASFNSLVQDARLLVRQAALFHTSGQ